MSEFKYDVFISHSKKDKAVVRDLADRLKEDGLKVTWGEENLQSSRALILVMSKAAVASDWVKLERQTLLFRDSTHSRRRFIPLLSEDCKIPGIIDQFAYMDWREKSAKEYKKLLAACRTDEEVEETISSQGLVITEAMVLKEHKKQVLCLAVTPDGKRVVSGSRDNTLRVWELPGELVGIEPSLSTRYTNAKVVLVGESGVGKTGLAIRLAEDQWEKTDSTHGMNVWQLELPGVETPGTGMDREVWLWDFAGQPDYRLIHQLYMDETALALMVIDPQRDNPFESLGQWWAC